MRMTIAAMLAIAPLAACATGARSAPQQQGTAASASRSMDWLVGCWAAERGAMRITEEWRADGRERWIGSGRTVRRDTVIAAETTRLFWRGDTLVYAATPANQPAAEFRAVRPADPRDVTFANPAHDFPQRIRYRLAGDSLHARIDGERDGRTRGIDYPYARVACDR